MFYFDYFSRFIERMHLHQKKLVFFGVILVFAGYSSFSAAMGSEVMKLFVILFSSFMTCRHSREIFLILKKFPLKTLNQMQLILIFLMDLLTK